MAQQITEPANQKTNCLVTRMANAMKRITDESGHCLDVDLIDAGFSPADIRNHAMTARATAARMQ